MPTVAPARRSFPSAVSGIPVQLGLVEVCATALMEAAGGIEAADELSTFLAALERNHSLWLIVRKVGVGQEWHAPSLSDAEFVISQSSKHGVGVSDSDISALVAINLCLARELAIDGDIPRIRKMVRLASPESDSSGFFAWLLGQIGMANCLMFPRLPSVGACRQVRRGFQGSG